jgi:hypothetical protein
VTIPHYQKGQKRMTKKFDPLLLSTTPVKNALKRPKNRFGDDPAPPKGRKRATDRF